MSSNFCSHYCCLSECSYHSHLYRFSFSPSFKGYLKCHHLQEVFLESDSMSQLGMRVSCFALYLLLYCGLSVIFNIFIFFISLYSVFYSSHHFACQCRRHKRLAFNPWIRKIPWRRKWLPTPVFLPGESHRQPSGHSPWGRRV